MGREIASFPFNIFWESKGAWGFNQSGIFLWNYVISTEAKLPIWNTFVVQGIGPVIYKATLLGEQTRIYNREVSEKNSIPSAAIFLDLGVLQKLASGEFPKSP